MARPVILTCAVTGSGDTIRKNPAVPVTPRQIAEASLDAAKAGATIVHIHVRDPDTGKASNRVELFQEVVDRIRERDEEVIVNVSTGFGDRLMVESLSPLKAGDGTNLLDAKERLLPVTETVPELCSLDFNTMNQKGHLTINSPDTIRAMAREIKRLGVKPELEIFDSGDAVLACELIEEGLIEPPPFFQIVTGVKYGFPCDARSLHYALSLLPQPCNWSSFGIGAGQFPMVAQSFLAGGHVRVGLEDNLYLGEGLLAPSNAALVDKAAKLVSCLGGRLATPAEARRLLSPDKESHDDSVFNNPGDGRHTPSSVEGLAGEPGVRAGHA